jgi:hypothetical protein
MEIEERAITQRMSAPTSPLRRKTGDVGAMKFLFPLLRKNYSVFLRPSKCPK